jgi:CRP/FNR family transcriptional regulator, cyclic AMP receptor protein
MAGTLMARLDEQTRAELIALGVRRTAAAETMLLREGEVESHVVLLLDALVKVSGQMADGRLALLSIRVSGDLIGEISALNGTPRSATAIATTRCTYAVIGRREFRLFLRTRPEAALEVAGIVADRLRSATRRRIEFASYPIRVRLARVLAEIAERYGTRTRSGIRIELTQPEIAGLCGAADVSLQRAMRELRQSGVVDTQYRRVVVTDLAALRALAELDGHDQF